MDPTGGSTPDPRCRLAVGAYDGQGPSTILCKFTPMLRGMESQDASPSQIHQNWTIHWGVNAIFRFFKMTAATNKPSRSGHRGPNILRPGFIDNDDDDDDDDDNEICTVMHLGPLLIKCENFWNPRWQQPPSCKIKNRYISNTVWRILTKFGTVMHLDTLATSANRHC